MDIGKMLTDAVGSIARAASSSNTHHTPLCPCGSGHYGYRLYNVKGQYLMYCCFACEKKRRGITPTS